MMERSRGIGNKAASTGSAVHGGLEMFVKAVYIDKTDQPSLELIVDFYKLSYSQVFNSFDYTTQEYLDGWKLTCDWFQRTSFENVEVLMAETKLNFPIPSSAGPITFNYIFDRFDRITNKPGEFRVVDYKTNRWNITPAMLRNKIQARAYGLAAAIYLKQQGIEWTRIWVLFDMLRHGPSGTVFTREDNIITWRYLKDSTEAIIALPEDEAEERLNPECRFCVRKTDCDSLRKNVAVGGIMSLETIEEMMDLRAQLEWQLGGIQSLVKDMDDVILAQAKERDLTEYETEDTALQVTMSRRREADAEMVHLAIGDKLFEKYGEEKITMGAIDKLLKGKELDDEQKGQLKSLIYNRVGEPKVKITAKNTIDDD